MVAQHLRIAAWVPIIAATYLLKAAAPEIALALPKLARDALPHSVPSVQSICSQIWSHPDLFFLLILFLRYYRLIGHLYAYKCLYKPDEVPEIPTVTGKNVHVVISTIDPGNPAFHITLRSILDNQPGVVTIACGGTDYLPQANATLETLRPYWGQTAVRATSIPTQTVGNKRKQMRMVLDELAQHPREIKDTILVFVDDHAWWEGTKFLDHLLAPFEDPKVGLVGTKKEVRRERGDSWWPSVQSLINFIGCIYLERHNFEITAQNALDGGAFVISARTCAIRAPILMEEDFREGFTNEYFFFGRYGPIAPDDDNYITRYCVRKGWNIKFQNHPSSIMFTTIGIDGVSKIHNQLLRWARSQWRSNGASLFTDRSCWRRGFWWTTHAGFITSFINYAAFWDPLIVYAWYRSTYVGFTTYHLIAMIIGSKLVKLSSFFARHPRDLIWFPAYLVFAYAHTFYKLWALVTFWDCGWSGRSAKTTAAPDAIPPAPPGGDHPNDFHTTNDNNPLDASPPRSSRHPSPSGSNGDGGPGPSDGAAAVEPEDAAYQAQYNSWNSNPESLTQYVPSPPRSSRHSEVSNASSNSFTALYGRNPRFSGPPNRFTPWGTAQTGRHGSPSGRHASSSQETGSSSTTIETTSSHSRSASPANILTSPPQPVTGSNTFRVPSSSPPSSQSSPAQNPSTGQKSRPFTRSQAPSPSAAGVSTHLTVLSSHQTPPGPVVIATPVPPTPPYQPFPSELTKQHSVRVHNSNPAPAPALRTMYTRSMPVPPARTNDTIFYKKKSGLLPDSSTTQYNGGATWTVDTMRQKFAEAEESRGRQARTRGRVDYSRDFVRGDDCQRVHPDGTYLTPSRYFDGGRRRCRSPQARDPVVNGRRL